MSYRQTIDACLSKQSGDGLLERAVFDDLVMRAAGSIERLSELKTNGSLPMLDVADQRDDLAALAPIAGRFADQFDDVIILGTGGSSMGGQAILALTDTPNFVVPKGPRIHFIDNIDPHTLDALTKTMDFARTGLIVISKSGGTAETLAQFLVITSAYTRALGEGALGEGALGEGALGAGALKGKAVAITQPGPSPLRQFAQAYGMDIIDHDPNLGGRYSVLSVVGALPALIRGLSMDELRLGASGVLEETLTAGSASAPAIGAAASVGLSRLGYGITVLLPYVDRLAPFGMWYRQLWAESLGKRGKGTTPVRAMGTVDQHSQLQLYLDGPRDKMFTFLMLDVRGAGGRIETGPVAGEELDYLSGRRMGDLMDAEQRATADTLTGNRHPTRILSFDVLDERTLGALFMHFMLETVIAADLLGVDPFDQPAVEDGKVLAREYLSRMKE